MLSADRPTEEDTMTAKKKTGIIARLLAAKADKKKAQAKQAKARDRRLDNPDLF
jgi:hypothetical protein